MPEATAFWSAGDGSGFLKRSVLPDAPPSGHLRIRSLFSGISRGTETLVFRGGVPMDIASTMQCPFQEGAFPGPVKYGYMAVGEVVDGAADRIGDRVFALHPHQTLFDVPEAAARTLPEHLPTRRAVLAANMETALNILWDAAAAPAERIAVVGLGVVGLLTLYLAARLPGAEVIGIDVDPQKGPLAIGFGAHFREPGHLQPDSQDRVVHTSAHPDGLGEALRIAGQEATVAEASWYGDRPVPAPLGAGFHPKRLTLMSTQVGQVAPAQRPRWSYGRRLDAALTLLQDHILDTLLGEASQFDRLPDTMKELSAGPAGTLTSIIEYPPLEDPNVVPQNTESQSD